MYHSVTPNHCVEIHPRYLAASPPRHHRLHLDRLAETYGWPAQYSGAVTSIISPCARVEITEDRTAEGRDDHLLIHARPEADAEETWRAELGGHVPIEVLTSLTVAVATGMEIAPDHLLTGSGPAPRPQPVEMNFGDWRRDDPRGGFGIESRDDHVSIRGDPAAPEEGY